MKGDTKVIELLNKTLTNELTAINQCLYMPESTNTGVLKN
jgi:bacterioferritin (cytochrome b1)